MIKNNKGVTLIELLISISIGSVILTMLMGILSSSLLTKNEAEYINRLNDEVFYINEYLIEIFNDDRFTSIEDVSPNEDVTILLITEEYSLTITDNSIEEILYRNEDDPNYIYQHILVLDRRESTNGLYYGPYTDDYWNDVDYVFKSLHTTLINGPNLIFTENTNMNIRNCVREFNVPESFKTMLENTANIDSDAGEYLCARAFIEFDFELEYNLVRGNKLSARRFTSTLFF